MSAEEVGIAGEVGIGIVGYGTMGKAHSYGYAAAPQIRSLRWRPRLRAISGRNRAAVEQAGSDFGAERVTTDWRELVESPDVEIVDICTPPGHARRDRRGGRGVRQGDHLREAARGRLG